MDDIAQDARVDADAQAYIAAVPAEHRPLLDRVHHLVLAAFPTARVTTSYKILCYVADTHRLYLGAWKHGISLYGWQAGQDGGFTTRHPELTTGRGTIRLTHDAATTIADDEIAALVRAALSP